LHRYTVYAPRFFRGSADPVPRAHGRGVFDHQRFEFEGAFVAHLGPVRFDDLDAVILRRVVGCGDHDPAVETVVENKILQTWCWNDIEVDDVASACHKSSTDRGGKRGSRGPGVAADADFFSFAKHGPECFGDFQSKCRGHIDAGHAADPVRAEIFFFTFFKCHMYDRLSKSMGGR